MGEKYQAIEAYNKAIMLKPDYADAYFNKGVSLNDLGQKKEAIEIYDLAI